VYAYVRCARYFFFFNEFIITFFSFLFQILVADTQLYQSLCRSVGPLVRRSVGPSIRLSVMIELKSGKTNVLDTFCTCLCVRGGDWGLAEGWTPLPTRPQRYCEPASLVDRVFICKSKALSSESGDDAEKDGQHRDNVQIPVGTQMKVKKVHRVL